MTPVARGRLRELLAAGVLDSFGLALGWTAFMLLATARGGLSAAALYGAAMLAGVVLSAPATAWLAGRLSGRTLLTGCAGAELVLRLGTLAALLAGWPAPLVAAGVLAMNVAAFAGYAAMRAEVAAVDPRPGAMTRYATAIAAVEAAGAGAAALLPIDARGTLHGGLMTALAVVYAASLLPTLRSARRARVTAAPRRPRDTPQRPAPHPAETAPRPASDEILVRGGSGRGGSDRRGSGLGGREWRGSDRRTRDRRTGDRAAATGWPTSRVLAAGAGITLLGTGPTLLSVALAAQLHGQASVAGTAAAFSAGCLLAPAAVRLVDRLRVPATLAWPVWAIGMLAGWVGAPWSLAGLLAAQLLSGLSLTAFEGTMDARVARTARPGAVTTALAWSASTRALGSAVAVRALPFLVTAPRVGYLAAAAITVLALAALGARAHTARVAGRPAGAVDHVGGGAAAG